MLDKKKEGVGKGQIQLSTFFPSNLILPIIKLLEAQLFFDYINVTHGDI